MLENLRGLYTLLSSTCSVAFIGPLKGGLYLPQYKKNVTVLLYILFSIKWLFCVIVYFFWDDIFY